MIVSDTNGFKDLIYTGPQVPSNTVVYILTGAISTGPSRTSIQIGPNQHIEDDLGQYINHSCNPTVKISGYNLVSVKELNPGDSITFNYNDSEALMSNPFYCNCCNKLIGGKYHK